MNNAARRILAMVLGLLTAHGAGGCAAFHLAGAMMQNAEYQKEVQTLAQYSELEGKSIAVLVDADLEVLYEHPRLVEAITTGVSLRIARDVPNVTITNPVHILRWQWNTPTWNAMPYGDIASSLGVDRVVFVDIYEYRLNPPGNRWLWEGVCAANVSVIERDGFDPDLFADTFNVMSEFPTISGVDRSAANEQQIETGLLAQFIRETAWLFHEHLEPKYPDKFQPGM